MSKKLKAEEKQENKLSALFWDHADRYDPKRHSEDSEHLMSEDRFIEASKEYAQSRLKAIAEEVEGLDMIFIEDHAGGSRGYIDELEVKKIIKQHLQDDNLD